MGKKTIHIEFDTICSFKHPLVVSECTSVDKGGLLYSELSSSHQNTHCDI